jgi:hypothetical protein
VEIKRSARKNREHPHRGAFNRLSWTDYISGPLAENIAGSEPARLLRCSRSDEIPPVTISSITF